MQLHLPFEPLFILYQLQQAGFEAYIVGGAVRDILINTFHTLSYSQSPVNPSRQASNNRTNFPPQIDFDFTTNATPEQIQQVFPDSYYENQYGTVSVTYQHLWELMVKKKLHLPTDNTTLNRMMELVQTAQDKPQLIDLARATKIHRSLQKPEIDDNSSVEDVTVTIPSFEITTYRSDGVYRDYRRPETVTWGTTIEQDLNRRDFTINAMALHISQSILQTSFSTTQDPIKPLLAIDQEHYSIVDHHQGFKDLSARIIRTVDNPDTRFQEDALRMLRAIRLAVQLNMTIEDEASEAITDNASLVKNISFERIRVEVIKMLASNSPAEAFSLMDKTGLLKEIMPELLDGKGVNQRGHHTTDVWVHSLDALAQCPSPDPIVRLATLLHDVGKPQTYREIDGKITFYNHEIVSSRIASRIGKRLKLSKKENQRLFTLVRYHMFYYQPNHTDAAIRRFMRKVGLINIDDILALREGDRLGSGARKTSWRLEEMKQRMIDQLHQPMAVTDLAIDGHDLMKELELKPGPKIGRVLQALFELVLNDPKLNKRQLLLEKAKDLVNAK